MASPSIGQKYDDIAAWWDERHKNSDYGIKPFEKALSYSAITGSGTALDIGCGSGGRFIKEFEARNFDITGVDASAKMIELAQINHPHSKFIETLQRFVLYYILYYIVKKLSPRYMQACNLLTKFILSTHTFNTVNANEGVNFYFFNTFCNLFRISVLQPN